MRKKIDISAGPELEPVSLTDAKTFLRVDGTEEDALIKALITTARNDVEQYLTKSLLTQTRTLTIVDTDSMSEFELVRPVQSVASVATIDEEAVSTTILSSTYVVNTALGRITFKAGVEPVAAEGGEQIKIVYLSGYGDTGSDVPGPIKSAILHTVSHLYENRETDEPLPRIARSLLSPFRDVPL